MEGDVRCNIICWIRLPDVPFEFYNVESLRRIGNMIGKMIKVDRSTSVYDKGGFARICVEIDLKKPLIPTYLVFGRNDLLFMRTSSSRLMCGKYGHQKEGCPLNVCKATNPVSEQEKVEEVPVGDSSSKPEKDVNGKEGVEEGISSVSGVVGGNGGKSPEKDSISGGEPSTVSDGGQKIDESPFGKIKLLRRDFRGNLSEASVKKGIQENPVLAEVKGSREWRPRREALSVKDVVLGYNVGNAEFQGIDLVQQQHLDEPMCDQDKAEGEVAIPHKHLLFPYEFPNRNSRGTVRASQLGFSNMELIDCEGYSGGIWCLWNPSIASISVLERHHQFIHLQVNATKGHSWTLTVVYASPSCISRRVLWDNLSRLAQSDFSRWVDTHDLRDMGFVGPEFTWKRGMSEARLDRILVNNQWYDQFSNASISHLPFFKSDHRPLLLRLDSTKDFIRSNRPFRFIAAWALHENFDDFVRQSWLTDVAWCQTSLNSTRHALNGTKKFLDIRWITIWKELEDVLLRNPSFGLKSPGGLVCVWGPGTLGTFMAVPIGGGSPSALRL
ncbi:hypothetical protein K1719_047332 [Acacia pycnantha]|nr:hypothetical protein K1719_047332 [Acacia pycnantha]